MPKRKNRKAKTPSNPLTFINEAGNTVLLTLKQKLFGEAYVRSRGNGVTAAMEAGYKGSAAVLSSVAYENLRKPQITDYIRLLLKDEGLTDEYVDKELLVAIRQDAHIPGKVRAIGEYNKTRGRHKPQEVKQTGEMVIKVINYGKVKSE